MVFPKRIVKAWNSRSEDLSSCLGGPKEENSGKKTPLLLSCDNFRNQASSTKKEATTSTTPARCVFCKAARLVVPSTTNQTDTFFFTKTRLRQTLRRPREAQTPHWALSAWVSCHFVSLAISVKARSTPLCSRMAQPFLSFRCGLGWCGSK